MSFRSALSNPLPSSGNVGQVLYGNITTGGGLVSGTPQSIDNISLPAGVWSIQMSSTLNFACDPTSVNVSLVNPSFTTYFSANVFPYQSVTVVATVYTSNAVTITLNVPTSLSLVVTSFFGGGSLTVSVPSTSAGRFIIATKLA